MLGAIIGDIVGSRFEWHNHKSKDFELFTKDCRPTDDSIMTIAVAEAIMHSKGNLKTLESNAVKSMQKFGRMYPNAGYGGTFSRWIFDKNPQPYNSYGNGAGMRVSPCGFAGNSIEDVRVLAKAVTEVTHNHEEGLKAASVLSTAIFMARTGNSMESIKEVVGEIYDIDFTLDEIRDSYSFDVSCQGSVPQAFVAFFESNSFEDAIRNAISIGGDSDTIAAMTGSLAEAYYGIPKWIISTALEYLDANMVEVIYKFEHMHLSKMQLVDDEDNIVLYGSVFEGVDDCVDKVIPKGIQMQGTYDENGAFHTSVDPRDMKPDFSAFGDTSTKSTHTKKKPLILSKLKH